MTGALNFSYRVDFTDDLNNASRWQPLAMIVLTNSPQLIYDPDAATNRSRSYRVLRIP